MAPKRLKMASSPLVNHHHYFQHHTQFKQIFEANNDMASLSNSTATCSNVLSIDTKYSGLTRINNGTPKRRLSYNTTSIISTPPPLNLMETSSISMSLNQMSVHSQNENSPLFLKRNSSLDTMKTDSAPNSTNTTPFIKRKCLNKDDPNCSVQFTQIAYRKSSLQAVNSPYLISSVNLANEGTDSPKNPLNDSFESCGSSASSSVKSGSRPSSRFLPRRLSNNSKMGFNKHKSAPLSNISYSALINQQMTNVCSSISEASHHPLNDISNHIIQNKNISNMSFSDEQRDDVTDLENLIFGNTNSELMVSDQHQSLIKQSLDIDATQRNLIGDRTKQHILPIIQSNKHQDLHCISPETLVDVLNGSIYTEQISECIIIDSRYPYEYDGGHISTALNLFTKEKLYEEMFIKRLNFKKESIHKFTSSYSSESLAKLGQSDCMETNADMDLPAMATTTKRSIVIFHCEFSSERGPSLLRFLRNQDRSLNEHDYPNLYYPELYLLEGGYKLFYESFKNFCEPQTYKPMLHAEHYEDLKHFRAKAKSWEVSRHQIVHKSFNESKLKKKSVFCHTKSEQAKIIEETTTTSHRVIRMRQNL